MGWGGGGEDKKEHVRNLDSRLGWWNNDTGTGLKSSLVFGFRFCNLIKEKGEGRRKEGKDIDVWMDVYLDSTWQIGGGSELIFTN